MTTFDLWLRDFAYVVLAMAYPVIGIISLELVATREQSRTVLQDCDPIVRIAVLGRECGLAGVLDRGLCRDEEGTEMTVHPMLFNGPMIRALLREIEAPGTGKTQTRRLPKSQPERQPNDLYHVYGVGVEMINVPEKNVSARQEFVGTPYAPGDLIWCRETWTVTQYDEPVYRADATDQRGDRWPSIQKGDPNHEVLWRPSIHMPRWASRITLEVTDVRVQRVQEISEEDAAAEGLSGVTKDGRLWKWGISDRDGLPGTDDYGWPWRDWEKDPRLAFQRIWDSIYAKRDGCSWSENPWVVALTFRPILANVDAVLRQREAA